MRMLSLTAIVAVLVIGCSTTPRKDIPTFNKVGANDLAALKAARGPASEDDAEPLEAFNHYNYTQEAQSGKDAGGKLKVKACGDLTYPESSHTAVNYDEAKYYFHVDCKTVSNAKMSSSWVTIDRASLDSTRKGWLTRWEREAVAAARAQKFENPRNASPYICFIGEVSEPLCEGPTAVLKNVEHFTTKQSTFESWKM